MTEDCQRREKKEYIVKKKSQSTHISLQAPTYCVVLGVPQCIFIYDLFVKELKVYFVHALKMH